MLRRAATAPTASRSPRRSGRSGRTPSEVSAWAAEHVARPAGPPRARRALPAGDRVERPAAADRAGARTRGARARGSLQRRRPASGRAGGCASGTRGRARCAVTCASAGRCPEGRPLVYVGDGVSDRCAARAADRSSRAAGSPTSSAPGAPARAVRDPRRRCCCPFLSRTTSSSRPSGSACSGPTSRTSGSTARSTARSAGARCGSRRRPAASTSSRSTTQTRPVVEKLLGLEFELDAFTTWAASQPVLAEIVAASRGVPPAALARPVREPRHLDHRAAGLAARGLRDPQPLRRAARHLRRARLCVPDARAGRGGDRGRARSSSASREGRPSTSSGSRAADLDLDGLALLCPTTRSAPRLVAVRGIGPWTAEWFLARHLARPRAWPAGDLALRKAVDLFYGSDVHELGPRLDPFQNLSAHYLLTASRMP